MNKSTFKRIVSKKYNFSATDEFNYAGNKRVYQHRFSCKDNGVYGHYTDLLHDLNYDYNEAFEDDYGDFNLAALYHYNIFTEEQWNELLPHIYYRDFNKDFDKLVKKVLPMFRKIEKYYDDIHLEFWQGIFSFGTHWVTKGKDLRAQINSKENGKLYCDTLIEIYPHIKEFLDKWKGGHYTLMERFTTNAGVLYLDKEKRKRNW